MSKTRLSETNLCNKINEDLALKKLIQITCSCSIQYSGRSKSSIGSGHRLVIIKPDSTVLIHSITGFKPVNWMRAPTETIAEYSNQKLILRSQRTKKPYEDMEITIEEILDYHANTNLRDDKELDLTHTEKDLQEHLAKNTHLIHPRFRLKTTQYKSPLGIFDLYGKIGDTYVVVELKVERAGLPAALQIKRYRDWLKQYTEKTHAILIAPSITPNALILLRKEKIEYKKIKIQDLNIKKTRNKTLEEWS
ncbi:MAG: endonuclease NucS [Candidatus Altiarchaeota archaeon]|nr:endonuclease NucS [Candidatus Altiarchaeota archaeon]